jgi:hypothetical protein
MALSPLEDISAKIGDLNAEDRVFRTANGYVVKVKHRLHVKTADMVAFKLTGSLCDERGKALEAPAGFHPATSPLRHWILDGEYAHLVVRMFHAPDVHPGEPYGTEEARGRSLEDLIATGRDVVVRNVEQAAIAHAEAEAVAGLGPLTPSPPNVIPPPPPAAFATEEPAP